MAARLKIWETLLGRALELIDSAGEAAHGADKVLTFDKAAAKLEGFEPLG
jgi:hypothetical protein